MNSGSQIRLSQGQKAKIVDFMSKIATRFKFIDYMPPFSEDSKTRYRKRDVTIVQLKGAWSKSSMKFSTFVSHYINEVLSPTTNDNVPFHRLGKTREKF